MFAGVIGLVVGGGVRARFWLTGPDAGCHSQSAVAPPCGPRSRELPGRAGRAVTPSTPGVIAAPPMATPARSPSSTSPGPTRKSPYSATAGKTTIRPTAGPATRSNATPSLPTDGPSSPSGEGRSSAQPGNAPARSSTASTVRDPLRLREDCALASPICCLQRRPQDPRGAARPLPGWGDAGRALRWLARHLPGSGWRSALMLDRRRRRDVPGGPARSRFLGAALPAA